MQILKSPQGVAKSVLIRRRHRFTVCSSKELRACDFSVAVNVLERIAPT